MNKRVSIVIPVYNGSNYMKEAIDSALAQTYPNIEILVVNDGSTDDGTTDRIAKSYGDKIRYFEKENGGVSTALNLALKEMTGDYFSWLSHDDKYYPTKIEEQLSYLEKLPKNTILYTDYDVINENGDIISTVINNHRLLQKKPDYAVLRGAVCGVSLLIPKKAFDDYGLFDEKYRCIQDYLKWYEMMKTYQFVHMDKVLAQSRVHGKQVTVTSPKVISEGNYLWSYMMEHFPDEEKIKYEGSIYLFYEEMYRFLQTTEYDEAIENAKKHMEDYYHKEAENTYSITVFVKENGKFEDIKKTIESLEKQEVNLNIIIEGETKFQDYKNVRDHKDAIKSVNTDYYTFLNAGITPKNNWLAEMLVFAKITNKSVLISDYPRPISERVDNLCSFIVPLDGVIFKHQRCDYYENPFLFIYYMAKNGGSYIVNHKYLDAVKNNSPLDYIFEYMETCVHDNECTFSELSSLCYDISCIYNETASYFYKTKMYEPCDELKEMMFSRSFQLLKKYLNHKKKK
ncbi:MAG: glycosyltransferase [Bacilli bacterium]|nr:glycosyltransferase [Bacilli bacterium]